MSVFSFWLANKTTKGKTEVDVRFFVFRFSLHIKRQKEKTEVRLPFFRFSSWLTYKTTKGKTKTNGNMFLFSNDFWICQRRNCILIFLSILDILAFFIDTKSCLQCKNAKMYQRICWNQKQFVGLRYLRKENKTRYRFYCFLFFV